MDGTVRVWNLQTGQCQHTLTGHTSLVGLLGLSPSYLVSAAADSTLRIWDPDTGDLRHTLAAHTGAITCFQHDEFKVLSGSDGNLKMWNIRDGAVVRDLLTGITGVWQVVFEGRWCVAASNRNDATVLDVWDFGNEDDEEWLGEPPGGLYDEDGFSDAEEDEDEFTKRIKRMTEIEEDNDDQEQVDINAMDQDLALSESESLEVNMELRPRQYTLREENRDDDVDIDIQGDSDTEPMGVGASRWAPTSTVTTTRTTHTRPRVGPSRRPQLPSSGGPPLAPLIGQLPDNNETPTRPRRPLTRRL
jgi:F-box and WD-40 domain protein CDC4